MLRARGFTLIELIMVIVLLAIVATVSVRFVTLSTRGALDVSARQQRALQAVVISEQITRELREAFPLSIRTSGECLEWLPLEGATGYTSLPTGGGSRIEIVPFDTVPSASPMRAIVYGYGTGTDALYGNSNPGPVSSPVANIDNTASPPFIELQAPHRFAERSPERRVFLVGEPVSLCQSGRYLYRYSGYGRNTSQPVPPAGGSREVLSANVTGTVDFTYLPATFQRAAVVQFTYTLRDYETGSDETTTVSQEVQIRNVP
ncbi:type II secretion system protein J [Marinobacter sediminum]|uniref:PulJ/GspJ family protein n=1 Tax=Marinobacter sediminum TaxID=256323 RepID=UPI003568B0DB